MTDLESKLTTEDRKSPYRMDNDWANPTEIINMPPKYRQLKEYNATLGNSHFFMHCIKKILFFGILGIFTIINIMLQNAQKGSF